MAEPLLQRLGFVMEPEPGNPPEVEGVLNPAAARGPDGQLYLFPRLVARGNYSRIGIGRVRFNEAGDPVGVERLGIALEPEADYERRSDGSGGCEDPRITFVEPLQRVRDDLHGAFFQRPTDRPGPLRGPVPLAPFGARDLQPDSRGSSSTAWMIRMPRCSPSPFPIHSGNRRWPSSTGRFLPVLARRKP